MLNKLKISRSSKKVKRNSIYTDPYFTYQMSMISILYVIYTHIKIGFLFVGQKNITLNFQERSSDQMDEPLGCPPGLGLADHKILRLTS